MGNTPSHSEAYGDESHDVEEMSLHDISSALESSIRQLGDTSESASSGSNPSTSTATSTSTSMSCAALWSEIEQEQTHNIQLQDQGIDVHGEVLLSRVPRGKYAEFKAVKELFEFGLIDQQQMDQQTRSINDAIEPSKAFNSPFSTDRTRHVRLQQLLSEGNASGLDGSDTSDACDAGTTTCLVTHHKLRLRVTSMSKHHCACVTPILMLLSSTVRWHCCRL
jgi:hypothetical protein